MSPHNLSRIGMTARASVTLVYLTVQMFKEVLLKPF